MKTFTLLKFALAGVSAVNVEDFYGKYGAKDDTAMDADVQEVVDAVDALVDTVTVDEPMTGGGLVVDDPADDHSNEEEERRERRRQRRRKNRYSSRRERRYGRRNHRRQNRP